MLASRKAIDILHIWRCLCWSSLATSLTLLRWPPRARRCRWTPDTWLRIGHRLSDGAEEIACFQSNHPTLRPPTSPRITRRRELIVTAHRSGPHLLAMSAMLPVHAHCRPPLVLSISTTPSLPDITKGHLGQALSIKHRLDCLFLEKTSGP